MTTGQRFEKLVQIMAELRSENGCPWDKEQTHLSLRQYLIEEAYEVLECLDEENISELPKELGDLLLQIVFHAQIARENDEFSIDDVLNEISQKLIRRHPHVYGDVEINSAAEQSVHWEQLKKHEGKRSVLDGVPKNLPGLQRASRLQQKAATVGFDWPDISGVWDKIHEELQELQHAIESKDKNCIEDEYGDLLFALVNLGRFLEINPEDALRRTIEKFISRFGQIEKHFSEKGQELHETSLEEMESIWQKAKEDES